MAKQAKEQTGEGHALEHGTAGPVHLIAHDGVPSVSPDQQTQLDELKMQYQELRTLLAKQEERIAKLENPAHVEHAVVKHLKRNLGVSGLPARGDRA